MATNTGAAELSYFERFTQALTNGASGFISDVDLVDTNNLGPIVTNSPISFEKFRASGELRGIKLGMRMSEVISAWGKPSQLYTWCMIGPRFGYGPTPRREQFGDLSLSFSADRLILIGIRGRQAEHLIFDNGLTGKMGMADYKKVLGEPSASDLTGLFGGDIAYRASRMRTDFRFGSHLLWAAVRFEHEAQKKAQGEQTAPPNGGPATSLGNSDGAAQGRHR